jgi:hypothetical protein
LENGVCISNSERSYKLRKTSPVTLKPIFCFLPNIGGYD